MEIVTRCRLVKICNRARRLERWIGAAALALLSSSMLHAATGPFVEFAEAKVRLVSGWESVPRSADELALDLGVEFVLAPGWHVYWKNSGDAGYAPKLDLSSTGSIRDVQLLFPAPHRFDLPGDLVSFGYEGEVIYPVAGLATPPAAGPWPITGRIDFLACAAECIPFTAELRLDLPEKSANAAGGESSDRNRLEKWRRAIPREASAVTGAPEVRATFEREVSGQLALELATSGGSLRLAAPDLFFETHSYYALGKPALSIGASGLRFRVPVHPLDETKPVPASTPFAWTLTGLEGSEGTVALAGIATLSPSARAIAGTFPAAESATAARDRVGRPVLLAFFGILVLAFAIGSRRRNRNDRSTHNP